VAHWTRHAHMAIIGNETVAKRWLCPPGES
jgi:hypothetical protein